MDRFYLQPLLLTADRELGRSVLFATSGLQRSNPVFKERARSWARRMIGPRPGISHFLLEALQEKRFRGCQGGSARSSMCRRSSVLYLSCQYWKGYSARGYIQFPASPNDTMASKLKLNSALRAQINTRRWP